METQAVIPASLWVYLFADQFSEPAKDPITLAAIAPRTGMRISAKPLVINLYLSALMELVETGVLRLETIEVKKLLESEKFLAFALAHAPVEKVSGLAWQIVRSIQAAKTPEQRRAREVVIRVIGGRSSTYYPCLVALSWSIGEAEAHGFIQRPEKKPNALEAIFNPTESLTRAAAVADCVNPLEASLGSTRSRLQAFEQSLGVDAPSLRREIENGIDECTEHRSD